MVTGQISSAGSSYVVLFDSGATHSFVATRVIDKLCTPSLVLDRGFQTLIPSGDWLVSQRWVRALPVEIEGRVLILDLIELAMGDYDMILGMDWLSKYGQP